MAQVFSINYQLKDSSLTAGILAETREKAVDFLYKKVGRVTINSVSVDKQVHAIDNEIVDNYINNSDKIKKYKNKIKNLNDMVSTYESEVAELHERIDQQQQKPSVSSKDLKEALKSKQQKVKVYGCPYCDEYESETKRGLKSHITKMHKSE